MNYLEYISSGKLESYVLGTASIEECTETQQLMVIHPEIKQELEAIEKSLIMHAESQVGSPPAHLRQLILDQIIQQDKGKVITMSERSDSRSFIYRFGAIAASILLIVSSAANVYLFLKVRSLHEILANLNNEKEQLANEFQTQKASYNNQLAFLVSPDSRSILLQGQPVSPDSKAVVIWNAKSKDVFINVAALPKPPEGKQYQLWALADGKPVDAGVFNVNDTSLQKMKNITNAQAFAVTLEKEGGSPVPTLTALYLMGNL